MITPVRRHVLFALPEQIETLFKQFDIDGGGTLDVLELKRALNVLKGDAREGGNERDRLEDNKASLWKQAAEAQEEFRKVLEADEQEQREREGKELAEKERKSKKVGSPKRSDVKDAKDAAKEARDAKDTEARTGK